MGIEQWLAMGGYGWFVWPSYAIALVILIWGIAYPLRVYRQLLTALKAEEQSR